MKYRADSRLAPSQWETALLCNDVSYWLCRHPSHKTSQIASFMGPTWGPSGTDRTQLGPMLAPWTLLSGIQMASLIPYAFNTLWPRQNGRHFPDDIFKWIFLNENVWISINISLNFAPRGPINNIPTLVQVMAWRRPGDNPLSEPMMVKFLTHLCVTRPQWVNKHHQSNKSKYWLPFEILSGCYFHTSAHAHHRYIYHIHICIHLWYYQSASFSEVSIYIYAISTVS